MIANRKALHKKWKDDFVPFVGSVFLKFPDVTGYGNEDLIVMRCETHSLLESVVKYLIRRGLSMTRDGSFADFAIVHGKHGIAMPCAWLDYRREENAGTVCLKPEREFLKFDWSDSGYEGPGWIAPIGHGFMVSQERDYDVWIDFTTGGTVVSLRRPVASLEGNADQNSSSSNTSHDAG